MALALGLVGLASQVASADQPAPLYVCKETPATAKIQASFSPDASLRDLVTWLAGFTCKTVIVDSEVHARAPKVTIVSPKAMTSQQAVQLFIDAVEATGMTVISKKDTIIIKLGPTMPKTCPTDTATVAASEPIDTKTADAESAAFEKVLAGGVKAVDATHYEIKRSVIAAITANPMAVAKGARVVPAVKDGKPAGFKLYAIKPGLLYARIGLQNGDTIQKLNGVELTSIDKFLEVYSKIREAKQFTLDLQRMGKPVTLVITIVKD